MEVVMVKHSSNGKTYWFEVPEKIGIVGRYSRVICDTKRGPKPGMVVSASLDGDDVKDVMEASGATMPLRKIIEVAHYIDIDDVVIPNYMAHTQPADHKLAQRFLEYYHNGDFLTPIVIKEDGTLVDGYSAYKVAKAMHNDTIRVCILRNTEGDSTNYSSTSIVDEDIDDGLDF